MADEEDFQLGIKHGYWILTVDLLCHNVAHLCVFRGSGFDCWDSLSCFLFLIYLILM
jgi:hypothetical protein